MAVGAVAGVLVVRRLSRALGAYTPEGLARTAAGLREAGRDFADRVTDAAAERESVIREAIAADAPGAPSGHATQDSVAAQERVDRRHGR